MADNLTKLNHLIDGKSVPPSSGEYRPGTNPSNGEPTVDIASGNSADVETAIEAASRAYSGWRRFGSAERGRILMGVANLLRERADEIADIEIIDTGKPRFTALAEIENSAAYFEFYATLVNLPVGDVIDIQPNQHVFTRREPFGVVGIIT
ncbi:MAG: aldehyde dehydrogenase family protein, partial [Leucobacter sp.]